MSNAIGAKKIATASFAILLLMLLVPFFSVSRASVQANNYNFSVSPGTSNGTGNWTVPANTQLTVNGSTNDLAVVNITMSGSSVMGFTFYFQGAPSSCSPGLCLTGIIPANHDVAGDIWSVTVVFYHSSGISQRIVAQIYPTIIVAPEFPIGSLLAIVAPLGALGFTFLISRKKSLPRILTKMQVS